jgi:hypothetical protein
MNLVWCACGRLVTFPGESRCEDCWALDQVRYHGRSRAVHTLTTQSREANDVPLQAEDRAARRGRGQGR